MTSVPETVPNSETRGTTIRSLLVSLVYMCHICKETKTEGRNLHSHLQANHKIRIPRLVRGRRHRDIFVKTTTHASHDAICQRIACPSCMDHFSCFNDYNNHLLQIHQSSTAVYPDAVSSSSNPKLTVDLPFFKTPSINNRIFSVALIYLRCFTSSR